MREDDKASDCLPFIDLTLLNHEATSDEILKAAFLVEKHRMACICVFPEHLATIPLELQIKRTTVINFPSGALPQDEVLSDLEQIITQNLVHEIDYVFPYASYLSGHPKEALKACHEISEVCRQAHLTFKVILETGKLPSPEIIYQLSKEIIQVGCDFLKTSTGKVEIGATLPAVHAMLMAIKDSHTPCGIKVSGGIRSVQDAMKYMTLTEEILNKKLAASFIRIGTSSTLLN